MMQPKFDNRHPGIEFPAIQTVQKGGHVLVHMGSIPVYLLHRWTRQQPSFWPAVPPTSGNVVRIEKMRIGGMRRSIARNSRGQNKSFEKPTRVRQMPLGGTHIR